MILNRIESFKYPQAFEVQLQCKGGVDEFYHREHQFLSFPFVEFVNGTRGHWIGVQRPVYTSIYYISR